MTYHAMPFQTVPLARSRVAPHYAMCEGRDPQRPIPWQTSDPPIGLMSRLSFWTTDPALLIRIPLARSLSISVWVIQYEARSPQLSILF